MNPDEAIDKATREAASDRYAGDPALEPTGFDTEVDEPVTLDLLERWAVIEVDAELYSTRKLGAPITFAKRALLRLMRQYTADLEARQTRFNLAVVARLRELERDR